MVQEGLINDIAIAIAMHICTMQPNSCLAHLYFCYVRMYIMFFVL